MHKEIALTKNQIALVDREDFEWINSMNWFFNSRGYAVKNVAFPDGSRRTVGMHRFVLGMAFESGRGVVVDHVNGNKLDNRRENLRICTFRENTINRKVVRNKTGFKGVIHRAKADRYVAIIQLMGKPKHLGSFATAEEAHEFYCLAADLVHGEFANHGERQ